MTRLVVVLIAVLLASPAWADPTCTGSNFSFDTPSNPQAQSYTVPNVPNRITLAYPATRNAARDITAGPTLGGVAMTRIETLQASADTAGELFYLLNATAGAQTFTATYDGLPLSLSYTFVTCQDVNQADPISDSNVATGSSSTTSVGCTSASGETVVDFTSADANTALGAGSGQTFIVQASPAADGVLASGASSEPGASGTVTMTHSITSNDWHAFCVSLAPAVTASAFGPLHRRLQ